MLCEGVCFPVSTSVPLGSVPLFWTCRAGFQAVDTQSLSQSLCHVPGMKKLHPDTKHNIKLQHHHGMFPCCQPFDAFLSPSVMEKWTSHCEMIVVPAHSQELLKVLYENILIVNSCLPPAQEQQRSKTKNGKETSSTCSQKSSGAWARLFRWWLQIQWHCCQAYGAT